MLLNRLQFGFYSVLARFEIAADYASVHGQLLERRTLGALSEDAPAAP